MLVLTRKQGQRIKIGDNITITITNVEHNQVKLGFDAPREVEINREEVHERKQKEKILLDNKVVAA